jgi:hypothetical protein
MLAKMEQVKIQFNRLTDRKTFCLMAQWNLGMLRGWFVAPVETRKKSIFVSPLKELSNAKWPRMRQSRAEAELSKQTDGRSGGA